ncbi:hypothetical protein MUK70_05075 [Dyadobacter chenwenxiniae]|uniref:Uncharacterized protein n=1 Tax=Dyadobacter chenwenxiniae TaxID=2906456 RepID=A0A9X1PSZ9_9BACT|nr:hypothetical protein [Dyadobacter chenwenxiniae]MCF0064581.1 hypothetical protein [Dyadobacter chenwenxiniae]UON84361.1 hypothetical protein MUK70_05075 [Dyadobacter chenwenxiniae]
MHANDQTVSILSGSKTLAIASFFLLVVLISRCSREKVAPDMNVPSSARDIVHQRYPSAEISKMRVLEHGKVYQLNFRFKGKNYQSVVNNFSILSIARQADDQIPARLLSKLDTLAIRGGKISNHRIVESIYDGNQFLDDIFDYELNGHKYVLTFEPYDPDLIIALRPYQQASYSTRSIEDLPEKIRQYINARHRPNPGFVNSLTNLSEQSKQHIINNNELTFAECRVNVLPDGAKTHEVIINYLGVTNLTMLFDDDGDLLLVPQFNRIRQFDPSFTTMSRLSNLKNAEIRHFRDLFAGQSQLFGFNLDSQQNFDESFRSEFENFKSYEFDLYNHKRERWSLRYNEQKELVNFFYSSQ